MNEKWDVKIADFGMSKVKALYLSDQNKSAVGTAAWAAPEVSSHKNIPCPPFLLSKSSPLFQVLRAESYSEKADVYSVGVIIWEVVTKK